MKKIHYYYKLCFSIINVQIAIALELKVHYNFIYYCAQVLLECKKIAKTTITTTTRAAKTSVVSSKWNTHSSTQRFQSAKRKWTEVFDRCVDGVRILLYRAHAGATATQSHVSIITRIRDKTRSKAIPLPMAAKSRHTHTQHTWTVYTWEFKCISLNTVSKVQWYMYE